MMPGTGDLLVIFLLILVLFGPDRLPDLARSLGKGLRELRKVSSEFQNQINQLAEIEPSRTSKPRLAEPGPAAEAIVTPAHPDSLHAREAAGASEAAKPGDVKADATVPDSAPAHPEQRP